jgi:hypothetical protein
MRRLKQHPLYGNLRLKLPDRTVESSLYPAKYALTYAPKPGC